MSTSRVPAGVPTGGQFALGARGESAARLPVLLGPEPYDGAHDAEYEEALASLRARLDTPSPTRPSSTTDGANPSTSSNTVPPNTVPLNAVTGADLPGLAFCSEHGFDPDLVRPVANDSCEKPTGGLWLAPMRVGADGHPHTAWSDFVTRENYRPTSATRRDPVALTPDATVLVIDTYDDLLAAHATYPPPDPRGLGGSGLWPAGGRGLDFEALARDGYAAIWLTRRGQNACCQRDHGPDMYGWDLESVLVLDPDAIHSH